MKVFPWLLQINWRWSRGRNQILEAHTHIARPPNSQPSPIDPNPLFENMARPLKNCIFEKKHSELWGSNFRSLRGKFLRLYFSGSSDCLLSPLLNHLVNLTNREAIKYYFRRCPKEYRLFDIFSSPDQHLADIEENIARIANAVQVATIYSEDKIDIKDLSTGR